MGSTVGILHKKTGRFYPATITSMQKTSFEYVMLDLYSCEKVEGKARKADKKNWKKTWTKEEMNSTEAFHYFRLHTAAA